MLSFRNIYFQIYKKNSKVKLTSKCHMTHKCVVTYVKLFSFFVRK